MLTIIQNSWVPPQPLPAPSNELLKHTFIFVYSLLPKQCEYTLRADLSTSFAKVQCRENLRFQRNSLIV